MVQLLQQAFDAGIHFGFAEEVALVQRGEPGANGVAEGGVLTEVTLDQFTDVIFDRVAAFGCRLVQLSFRLVRKANFDVQSLGACQADCQRVESGDTPLRS